VNTRRLLPALLAVALMIPATVSLLPSASAAEKPSGLIEIGGGSGDNRDGKKTNTCSKGPGKCDIPVCDKATNTGTFGSIKGYYRAPYPGCKPGIRWTTETSRSIVRCLVGYDEVRVYGTEARPVQVATLSRVNLVNWCPPGDADVARLYWPNPKDSAAGLADSGSVWATATTRNVHGDSVTLSDNCTEAIAVSGVGRCAVTSQAVRYAVDASGNPTSVRCDALKITGANTVSARLSSPATPKKLAASLRAAVYRHYEVVSRNSSKYRPALAASLSGQPVNGLTAPTITSASGIRGFDPVKNCSSPLEFIPAFKSATPTEPVVIGSCIMPIFLPARLFVDNTQPERLPNGQINPARNSYGFWGTWNENYVPRYDKTPVRTVDATSVFDPSIGTSIDVDGNARLKSAYTNAVRNLVKNDPGSPNPKTSENQTIGAYFYPDSIYVSNGVEVLLNGADGRKATETRTNDTLRANSAVDVASCWATKLASSVVECTIGDEDCPDLPPPPPPCTPGSPNCPGNTPPPCEPGSAGCPGGNTTTPPADPVDPVPSGPVSVTVSVELPGSYTVGGLSRVHRTEVTGVSVTCNGRPCGSRPSDPSIDSVPSGSLVLRPVGGYTNCSSPSQTKCGQYITRSSGSGPIASRSVESVYFSPTRNNGEAVRIVIEGASLRYTPKKLETYTVCGPKDPKTGKQSCSTRTRWVPDPANASTVRAFSIKFNDGKSADRPVTGTIGK
jgi:hypothetical protein